MKFNATAIGAWMIIGYSAFAQTSIPIYVSIVMHSEQTTPYHQSPVMFEPARTNLFRFASMLDQQGAALSLQSDWTFLTAATNYDQSGRPETGGTNIIAWLEQGLGYSIDPHNHMGQSVYTFADVAALVELCGAHPSGVIGGFTAFPHDESQWPLFQSAMTGAVYTSYVWIPEVLWGGASAGHDQDTNGWFSGIYRPQNASNLWNHLEGNLPWVGGWTGKSYNWTNLDLLVEMRAAGRLCTGRMYTCNIMTGMNDLNTPGFIVQFATELAARTNLPNVHWVTIPEMTNIWAATFGNRPTLLPYVQTNDFDRDGMTDGWEVTNLCDLCTSDGFPDNDGDLMSDVDEYTTGTDVTNAADYFRILSMTATSVTWRAGAAGSYIIQAGDDLDVWMTIHTNTGAGPAMQFNHPAAFPVSAFRIRYRD